MTRIDFQQFVVIVGCTTMFVLSAFLDIGNEYIGLAVLSGLLILAFPDVSRSSLAAVLLFSGITLFSIPILALHYVDPGSVQTAWFAAFILVGMALARFEPLLEEAPRLGASRGDLILIPVYLVAGLAFWRGEGAGQISFYAGWGLALLHLERLHASTGSKLVRAAGVGVFWLTIGLFMALLWSGAGRIIFLSFFLAPLFLTVRYGTFRLSTLAFIAAAVGLSFIGRVLRFGWNDGIAGIADDSGASHLTLTSYLWSASDTVISPGSVFEQWFLLFFNWLPRDLWPGKPVGIGSTFVDMYLGRQGQSLEHSTATGYFGEHLFYLPHFWWVSVILLTAVIILARRLIARFSTPYRAPVMAFDVWLITLFWGGMASFGARVWLALGPMLIYLTILKIVAARRRGGRPIAPALTTPRIA